MNIFITSFLICFFISSIEYTGNSQSRSHWLKSESPVNTFLRNLSFIDNHTGWAAGASGIIIHTTNGGHSWEIQNTNVTSFITDIFFLNQFNGWAITIKETSPFNTIILKTSDGGSNWTSYDFPDHNAFMTTIFFIDSLNGFLGGTYIAKTSDGGSTWVRTAVDSSMLSGLPVYKFKFYNDNFGYACGGATDVAGVIWKTTNGGLNWSALGLSPDEIFDLFIFDSLNAVVLSGDPEEFFPTGNIRTTNGGSTWTYEELSFYRLSFAIDFRTAMEGWSASGYKFLWTSNAGITWSEQQTPGGAIIYDLQFTDSRTGYAVGEDGVILKFIPLPVNVDGEYRVSAEFLLSQNYPNPFNPVTEISWSLPYDCHVQLIIYDVLGNKIEELINKELEAGYHTIEFSNAELKSGVYFYQIKAVENLHYPKPDKNSFTETKKMLLIK